MNIAARIIGLFGGTRQMARQIGTPPSTIQSWKEAGYVPAPRQSDLLRVGRECGVPIEPEDFFDPAALRTLRTPKPRPRKGTTA